MMGDCLEVMATLDAESVDAIVTDPPYGLEFMGKAWDKLGDVQHANRGTLTNMLNADGKPKFRIKAPAFDLSVSSQRRMQAWHEAWACEALRVAKPGAYLLAFGGTRTVHRMTCAIEDAGWIIRDMLVWGYATGFPKSHASLKPAWEPIVLARKPGPLAMLNIEGCRIGTTKDVPASPKRSTSNGIYSDLNRMDGTEGGFDPNLGRWPSNILLTDPVFDGDVPEVVGGGEQDSGARHVRRGNGIGYGSTADGDETIVRGGAGTYSRFFIIPKASRKERGPGNTHPTVKPLALMRHLVRLITPTGGVVLDPFIGSGTTALAAEREGFDWIGIEREEEYVKIAEKRLDQV